MISINTNISKIIRQIDLEKKAIFKDIGDSIATAVMKEFEQLVIETAQYTGTTAASWNIEMQSRVRISGGRSIGGGVRKQPNKSKNTALNKGHMDAVNIAVQHNWHNLDNIGEGYRIADIYVYNNAPGALTSVTGPLRSVNQGAEGAFARFAARVENNHIPLIRSRRRK